MSQFTHRANFHYRQCETPVLTEPSSAAGFAALLALLVPSFADQASAIIEFGMTALAVIVQRESSGR